MSEKKFVKLENGFYLELPGHPQPKERPRFHNGHAYTPQKTRDAEQYIRDFISLNKEINIIPKNRAVSVLVHISKDCARLWVTDIGELQKNTPRADADNYFKLFADSMQGLLFEDDNQITRLLVVKAPSIDNIPEGEK